MCLEKKTGDDNDRASWEYPGTGAELAWCFIKKSSELVTKQQKRNKSEK